MQRQVGVRIDTCLCLAWHMAVSCLCLAWHIPGKSCAWSLCLANVMPVNSKDMHVLGELAGVGAGGCQCAAHCQQAMPHLYQLWLVGVAETAVPAIQAVQAPLCTCHSPSRMLGSTPKDIVS